MERFVCACGRGPLPFVAWRFDFGTGHIRCPRCRGSPVLAEESAIDTVLEVADAATEADRTHTWPAELGGES